MSLCTYSLNVCVLINLSILVRFEHCIYASIAQIYALRVCMPYVYMSMSIHLMYMCILDLARLELDWNVLRMYSLPKVWTVMQSPFDVGRRNLSRV